MTGISLVNVGGLREVQYAPDEADFSKEFLNSDLDAIDVYSNDTGFFVALGTTDIYTYEVVSINDDDTAHAILVDRPED